MRSQAASNVVLIIEDVASIVRLVRAALADKPVEIVTVADGRRGLEAIHTLRPALVLLDLALPSLHGFDILTEVRSAPDTADVPVVIVTAQGDSETALKAQRLGADRFVAKPFLPNELRRIIDFYIDAAPTRSM